MKNKTLELLNIIYDTLMNNTDNEQFDVSCVTECEIDNSTGIISFDYNGKNYQLTIISIK